MEEYGDGSCGADGGRCVEGGGEGEAVSDVVCEVSDEVEVAAELDGRIEVFVRFGLWSGRRGEASVGSFTARAEGGFGI